MIEHGVKIAALVWGVSVVLLSLVFVTSSRRVSRNEAAEATVSPLASTVAGMLRRCVEKKEEVEGVWSMVEDTKFRDAWVTVYSEGGEVWADGSSPCGGYGKRPVPCSNYQSAMFREAASSDAKPGETKVASLPCPRGDTKAGRAFAVEKVEAAKGKFFLVVGQSCV